MEQKKVFLKDYKPYPFFVESIDLIIDIFDHGTLVHATQKMKKRSDASLKENTLELNGENLTLKEVKLNGKTLSSDAFLVSSDKLVLFNIDHNEFILETLVEINPYSNLALEGFYQSGPQLCTQCEPEGFRRITYFIDRPDNMAIFKTKMIADKKRYPHLLSNGNKIGEGDLSGDRHWVEWQDPFKKPCYLFAMVAGNFDVARDVFITKSGRKVDLEIFVDPGNLKKTNHAMESLKMAMKWDEEVYDLEYDLNNYMIVAVDSFNMGAMENKGLNIFNSAYTLADEQSGTDHDFQNIQSVIGHEYFHNWTGNRVTCRDWFQLTLKEGLTVFRDQEFSSDVLSRPVKRLEDVKMLKEFQFPEDAGPLAHPIRPSSFVEINNFYTRTVYEKGAEIIRMLSLLIGKEKFALGMKKYFELFDGKAVTTEDFIYAMELASQRDLAQFKNWYSRAGTPKLKINTQKNGNKLSVHFEQIYPYTSWMISEDNILHFPFKLAFVSVDGVEEHFLEITKLKQSFEFEVREGSVLSLNRTFSAPVLIDFSYSEEELLHLMSYDNDFYTKYEATQSLYESLFLKDLNHYLETKVLSNDLSSSFIEGFTKLLHTKDIEDSYLSYLLDLPSEGFFSQQLKTPDFEAIHLVRNHLEKKIGLTFFSWFQDKYLDLKKLSSFDLTPKSFGVRSLKNRVLSFIIAANPQNEMLFDHYQTATNMTEELHGLELYIRSGADLDHEAIQRFYHKWKDDSLAMIKWFSTLATFSSPAIVMERITQLESDPMFKMKVPNYIRALYSSFSRFNLSAFHQEDGRGYAFLAEKIIKVDQFNPQVAARISTAFSLINKLDVKRQEEMKKALRFILEAKPSRDTQEVVNKYLAQ